MGADRIKDRKIRVMKFYKIGLTEQKVHRKNLAIYTHQLVIQKKKYDKVKNVFYWKVQYKDPP